jgi:DHA2 family multidrug resistance protein
MKEPFFKDWVPAWLGNALYFVLLLPMLSLGGIYTPTVSDLVGGLGTLSEYFSLANYCATIGMIVGSTLLPAFMRWQPVPRLLLTTFLVLVLVHVGCISTTSPLPIVALSLVGGVFKIVGMVALIPNLMVLLSPTGERMQFNAIFTPLVVGVSQAVSVLSSSLAYYYNWQAVYAGFLPVLLVCLALVVLVVRSVPAAPAAAPSPHLDWWAAGLLTGALGLLAYVAAFGRYEDWWASPRIQGASLLALVGALSFTYRCLTQVSPLVQFDILGKGQVLLSCTLFMIMGLFLTASSLLSSVTSGVLLLNGPTNAILNLWMLPGLVLGGGYCYWWFRRQRGFKGILLLGFSAFVLSYGLLYLLIAPNTSLPDLYVPTMLRGMGMAILFVAGGVLINDKLSPADTGKVLFFQLLTRSLLGTMLFSAVFATATYRAQVRNTTVLAQSMDALDPQVLARTQAAAQAAAAGNNGVVATQQALYGLVRPQAALLASRELLGYVVWAGVGTLAFVLLVRIDPLDRRRLVNWRRRLRGQPSLEVEGL